MGRKRKIALGMGLLVVAGIAVEIATYRREAWLADYGQLKADLAQGYANLDWQVAHRGLDLAALDARTTAALEGSVSRIQAGVALRDFIRAFDDPHLVLEWSRAPSRAVLTSDWHRPAAPQASAAPAAQRTPGPPVADCRAAGYEDADTAFRLPLAAVPGWRTLADGPFPMGVVGDTGVLRIAAFGENQYLAACEAVVAATDSARVLQLKVREHLQARLEAQLDQLREAGIRRLVVDITGNGGGSEWVRDVIPLVTDRRLLRPAPLGPTVRCDRTAIWRNEPVCPLLDDQGLEEALQGRGLWSGPLQIWVDGGTASASEDFAAWLSDNGVAELVGAKTVGAGCGYINGGHRSVLPSSGLEVRMPNCARFLRTGRNEIEGLAPDRPSPLDAADLQRLLAGS